MAISCSFLDSVVYGTDDINKITKDLVGAGVSPFTTADTYNVSDLNVLTEALVGQGVQLDGCKCSVIKNNTTDMNIFVSGGVVFFENGVRLEVDDDGYDIIADVNKPGYVFANFNPSLQKGDILFDDEVSNVGESVVIAYIDELGNVTDLRKIAESKIASLGKNVAKKYIFERMGAIVNHNGKYVVAKIPGVDVARFNFAILASTDGWNDVDFIYFPDVGYHMAFFDIVNQKNCFSVRPGGGKSLVEKINFFVQSVSGYLYYPEIIGGELCIVCDCRETEVLNAIKYFPASTVCFV